MDNKLDNRLIYNHPIRPAQKPARKSGKQPVKPEKSQTPFKEVLANKLKEKTGVEFSKHARDRLISRDIKLNEADLKRLKMGVEKAAEKGSRDSLIMVDKVAYLVSIENRTVITAVDDKNVKENVFTNIDSAVFM